MNSGITIRNGTPEDYETIVGVMPIWWDGRDLTHMIMKLFFYHFKDTIFIAEKDGELVGFLIGFLSQSAGDQGYIHFAGVHPDYRKTGLGRALFHRFFNICKQHERYVVRSCTSPINKQSIAFHRRMGFDILPGDSDIDGLPVTTDYHRKNDTPKVRFNKVL